jgi:hypothetical protein
MHTLVVSDLVHLSLIIVRPSSPIVGTCLRIELRSMADYSVAFNPLALELDM